MAVDWGQEVEHCYPVDIIIHAEDRPNLLRDISLLFSQEKIQFTAIHASVRKKTNNVIVNITIAINNLQNLQKSLERLRQIQGVQDVKRQDPGGNLP